MKTSRAVSRKAAKRKPAPAKRLDQSFNSFLSADAQLIVIVSLVAIVFLCYLNTLGNEFVFDDFVLVLANKRIRSINLGLLLNSYRPEGIAEAVLVRAIEPLLGKELMLAARPVASEIQLTNGPAKFCEALNISRELDGVDLCDPSNSDRCGHVYFGPARPSLYLLLSPGFS